MLKNIVYDYVTFPHNSLKIQLSLVCGLLLMKKFYDMEEIEVYTVLPLAFLLLVNEIPVSFTIPVSHMTLSMFVKHSIVLVKIQIIKGNTL